MDNNEEVTRIDFTCDRCTSQSLLVTCYYDTRQDCTGTLPCKCGFAQDGIAAIKKGHATRSYSYWCILQANHSFHFEDWGAATDPEFFDRIVPEPKPRKKVDKHKVFCKRCAKEAKPQDWNVSEGSTQKVEESIDYLVSCNSCFRLVPFGWGEQDRGGGVWPIESEDFNPYRVWPDPEYKEEWDELINELNPESRNVFNPAITTKIETKGN